MKYNKQLTTTLCILCSFLLISACSSSSNESFAFQAMIRWDGKIYVGTDEKITNVERKIGSIMYYSSDENKSDKERSSNFYKKGTSIYQINSIDVEQALAVEVESGVYVKAIPVE
ncbi:hypothetical protein E0485_04930 [Paenibacillus albiflavus]|uniref:DUF3221 domain-containing protein n=1 Tax=Paenibacillus albiflavus TaxID=2545760 RepID=A0A4R4EJ44_9BACL|nr:hypothetical protein [Paenibacillus albiflavus]TCZ80196.1 hypothetical protein E0485_04930 [Paenibacillus albiflavus]